MTIRMLAWNDYEDHRKILKDYEEEFSEKIGSKLEITVVSSFKELALASRKKEYDIVCIDLFTFVDEDVNNPALCKHLCKQTANGVSQRLPRTIMVGYSELDAENLPEDIRQYFNEITDYNHFLELRTNWNVGEIPMLSFKEIVDKYQIGK